MPGQSPRRPEGFDAYLKGLVEPVMAAGVHREWRARSLNELETRRGVAWTAELDRRVGRTWVPVGRMENSGTGGPNVVTIQDREVARAFSAAAEAAYGTHSEVVDGPEATLAEALVCLLEDTLDAEAGATPESATSPPAVEEGGVLEVVWNQRRDFSEKEFLEVGLWRATKDGATKDLVVITKGTYTATREVDTMRPITFPADPALRSWLTRLLKKV